MVNNSNEFTRRILFFPAIRPCESVSFSGLLSSLIELGHSISGFKSKPFFSNRKNATNSIHLIETLLVFLEEIQNGGSKFETSSIDLCVSELHFIFQKIHFLLEDCTRDGARLWMLMKSEKVSTHFRALMRVVAVALDVLPPLGSEMDPEVEELAKFVRKQASKSQFEVDEDDRRAMRSVLRIVDEFEGGIAPESRDLKRVLTNLGIRSWKESNSEIKFLEGELGHEFGGSEERGVEFVSSLVAFLIYCRCTLFLNVETESVRSSVLQQSGGGFTIGGLNLDDFRCPISLEIMIDPVIISTGQTYDRCSILKWFKSGNRRCPKTGERVVSVDLVQNLALKKLIQQHCLENGIPFEESRARRVAATAGGGSVVVEQAMMLIAAFLVGKMVAGEDEEKTKAAFECRLLTKSNVFNRFCLVEADGIPSLLNLISSRNQGLQQENAMAALMNLSKHPKGKGTIVENGGLDLIVGVLNRGVKEARQHAAGALFYLSSIEDNRRIIGRTPGAIPGLMELIRDGSLRAKKNSLAAILGLLLYPENHWRILGGGIVLLLVNLLRPSETEDFATDSLAILASLAENLDGAMAIISAGILPLTIKILSTSDSRTAKEYGVSLLLSLCIKDGGIVVPLLAKDTSLMATLYSLLTGGSSRSSTKAGSLIRILQNFDEKCFMAPTRSDEYYVRVR
ncbi:hypothetical protein ACS0TY_009018 [Phlomoides rotata]